MIRIHDVRFLAWVACLLGGLPCACARAPDLPVEVQVRAEPIVRGKGSNAAQNSVVMIGIGNEGVCSGTLVAPNLVLTARHCVSETDGGIACGPDGQAHDGGGVFADREPLDLVVYSGIRKGSLRARARGAAILHDGASNLCNHDLAFLLLDRDVTAVQSATLRLGDTTQVGELVTAVGWGLTSRGALASSRMQRQGVEILDVGPSSFTPSNHLIVGESICSGDSGGPALSSQGAVIGVVSHGGNGRFDPDHPAAGCLGNDVRNVYTRVSGFLPLVHEAFAEAQAQPELEAGR